MILFVCETKNQVLNALNIKMSMYSDSAADVCFCNKTGILDSIISKVRKAGIFSHVYEYKTSYKPKQDAFSMFKKAFSDVNIIKQVAKRLPNLGEYDMVFISGPDLACIAVYYLLKKKTPDIKLCIYEEGIFEYYIFTYKYNKIRGIYSKLVYGSFYLDHCKEMYVYNPSAIVWKPLDVKGVAIPQIQRNTEICGLLNNIFDYEANDVEELSKFKYVFVESCFPDYRSENAQHDLVKKLFDRFGEELIVKMHPRSPMKKYDDIGVKVLKTSQTMEIIFMNGDFKDKVFFTMYSSAIFNMEFMFGLTPTVVLLNDVFNILSKDEGVKQLIENFKSTYPKDLLFNPHNQEELEECINQIGK